MKEYYRTKAVISLDAIRENLLQVRHRIGPEIKLMVVLKADAYGHGALPLTRFMEREMLADAYGVATAEEALALRQETKKMILILGAVDAALYPALLTAGISMTIFRLDSAKALAEAVEKLRKEGWTGTAKVHLALDTGMGRIGFLPGRDAVEEICAIDALPGIEIEGMFTHFARADERDKTSALRQFSQYQEMAKALRDRGIEIPLHHLANSAAIQQLPEVYCDMVRCGIITYGLYPSDEMRGQTFLLRPALSWQAKLTHVKEVPAGTAISYGGTYVTKAPARIATVPVGYADGYSRALSGRADILVRGVRCPVLGRICMDQFMADVTACPEAAAGDWVTLLGREQDQEITAEELGTLAGSFQYEMVCGISARVPRVYVEHGICVE